MHFFCYSRYGNCMNSNEVCCGNQFINMGNSNNNDNNSNNDEHSCGVALMPPPDSSDLSIRITITPASKGALYIYLQITINSFFMTHLLFIRRRYRVFRRDFPMLVSFIILF